jgi:hypothetical protein
VLTALHRWAGIGATLDAHRDCMAGRTCPGDAFYALKPELQAQLASALAVDPWPSRWGPIATPTGIVGLGERHGVEGELAAPGPLPLASAV